MNKMYKQKVKHFTKLVLKTIPSSRRFIDELNSLRAENQYQKKRIKELEGIFSVDHPIVQPEFKKQIIKADWRNKNTSNLIRKNPPFTINWVVPPMVTTSSGGHLDIFRSIAFLEKKGHLCHVYFYDVGNETNIKKLKALMSGYPTIKAPVYYGVDTIQDCDILFATHWHTAYPVYNFKGKAKRYYYIQDYEPLFEAAGTFSALAENTYKLGLRGVTLGRWLTDKLSKEYDMQCDYIDLAYEPEEYYIDQPKKTKSILFYGRPSTPRRGFEMGILTLELFHKENPDYQIHLVGADVKNYQIPFPYINHGILDAKGLNKLYNKCIAGLIISFTNMSLLPLEMLAAGCVPVINEAPSTTPVTYAKNVYYSQPSPRALADTLTVAVTKFNIDEANKVANWVTKYSWDNSNAKLERILIKDLC